VNDTAAEASVHGAEGGTDEFRSRPEVIPFDSSARTRRRVSMAELIADLFISVDGRAKGSRSPALCERPEGCSRDRFFRLPDRRQFADVCSPRSGWLTVHRG
jgi:hypothetical protein